MNNPILCTLILSSLFLTACDNKKETATPITSSSVSTTTQSVKTDAWIGKWNGPEGTFIEITGGNGNYKIIIQDLDGPKQYRGSSKGEQISFERNGITETIQASNGADTGMKWLAEKLNCLKVGSGEGWCRD